MSGCLNCGLNCIEYTRPRCFQIYECCPGKCTTAISLKPNTQYPRGTFVVSIKGDANGVGAMPYVFAPFDASATDGTQIATDAVIITCDVATDDQGKIINQSFLPSSCQGNQVIAYLCGRFSKDVLCGSVNELRAAGLDIVEINGEIFLRGGS